MKSLVTTQERQWLLELIAQESLSVRSFGQLLQQEQDLLLANQIDALPPVLEEKNTLAKSLQSLIDQRVMFCQRKGVATALKDVLAAFQEDTEIFPALEQLYESAKQVAEQNRLNGLQIAERMKYNYQALAILNQANERPQLYDRAGHTHASMGSGRSLGSA